jgi:hypothetical protein
MPAPAWRDKNYIYYKKHNIIMTVEMTVRKWAILDDSSPVRIIAVGKWDDIDKIWEKTNKGMLVEILEEKNGYKKNK